MALTRRPAAKAPACSRTHHAVQVSGRPSRPQSLAGDRLLDPRGGEIPLRRFQTPGVGKGYLRTSPLRTAG